MRPRDRRTTARRAACRGARRPPRRPARSRRRRRGRAREASFERLRQATRLVAEEDLDFVLVDDLRDDAVAELRVLHQVADFELRLHVVLHEVADELAGDRLLPRLLAVAALLLEPGHVRDARRARTRARARPHGARLAPGGPA